MNRGSAGQVVALPTGELRQAEYYRALLDQRRGRLEAEIAVHAAALQTSQHNRAARELRRLRRLIGVKRREQFELDRLHAALQHRFFPDESTPVRPMRCFEVEIGQSGSWWRIRIPELDAVTTVRQREDAELTAREHIAVIVNTPIAEIGVRVVSES